MNVVLDLVYFSLSFSSLNVEYAAERRAFCMIACSIHQILLASLNAPI